MVDDRRLIEDYLPIQAISKEAAREKAVRSGHISNLHLWWARRPLVAARAAVYGSLVPATQFVPPNGTETRTKSLGRANAAKFVERLCKYPGDPKVIAEAERHVLSAHAERLTQETGETVTVEDIEQGLAPRPRVLDMFAGGGAIPLEALRLGCEAYALDLNPVAHIIELCTLVYPQKYGKADSTAAGSAKDGSWAGLAAEVEHWGKWVLERVRAEIGDLYAPIPDPAAPQARQAIGEAQLEMAGAGFESSGQQRFTTEVPSGWLTPVAYLWTRTVRCKNPTCGAVVPLVKQTWLRKKKNGRCVALKMMARPGEKSVRFQVVEADTTDGLSFDPGLGSEGGNVTCPFCGSVADAAYVQSAGIEKRIGKQLMAIACTRAGSKVKVYIPGSEVEDHCLPSDDLLHERLASVCKRTGLTVPYEPINPLRPSPNARGLSGVTRHGLTEFGDLFSLRQLLCLMTFASSMRDAEQAMNARNFDRGRSNATLTILALAVNKVADLNCSFTRWKPDAELCVNAFGRQALAMVWDFAEQVPYSGIGGSWQSQVARSIEGLNDTWDAPDRGFIARGSATTLTWADSTFSAVVTDPPYYDNVPYGDVSDFFYVWLKRTIGHLYPEHFSAELTPKRAEATALASRHAGDMRKANAEYESMMLRSFREAARVLKPDGSMVVVYAHKTTLGWATLVDAMRRAEFTVTEAWPLDTEMGARLVAADAAALASSIFLVARKRTGAETGSYEDDVQPDLERIVRERVETLWEMGIVGADLVIAAVGAGLRAFTRFERVEYANGEEVPAERFLAEVEGVVLETLLEKIFDVPRSGVAAVDGPSRFYVLWRYTYKAAEMDAGEAIVFTYGQRVELDGPRGLSHGSHALAEKKKGNYRLRDFSERGRNEDLGLPADDGTPAPLIDVLHRLLWLMEYEPRSLIRFLDEARPDRERLRLVAQALAGAGLKGKSEAEARTLVATTSSEQAALGKLTANWRALIESSARPLL
ncbi:MAG: DUF1156 domain-containing protein [Chloroflexota bacterium]